MYSQAPIAYNVFRKAQIWNCALFRATYHFCPPASQIYSNVSPRDLHPPGQKPTTSWRD